MEEIEMVVVGAAESNLLTGKVQGRGAMGGISWDKHKIVCDEGQE